ncbi:uncharacterized protein RJT21DRAFT_20849 [Scheffersomyces amazonensis]|uniref:uncharacterized protein n=1 Tax=Scheffersomyces amazonensis TaxID=1078765 RepID=UPI00315D6B5E
MDSNSTSVSIGKFPFDYTEDQVLEIAKSVGPVIDLKLLFDELTGKSKGYAIINYGDNETASSAVRNLNYMTLPNGRFLKCSFITDGEATNDRLPILPLGVQIHPNENVENTIANIVSSIDQTSGMELLREIKKMSKENPNLTKLLLEKFPQLAHALVELTLLSNTSNKELIELTLNKRQAELNDLSSAHVQLLKDVHNLSEEEIKGLDEAKQAIILKVKQEIDNGTYGQII